jgi:hypothetical protein
MQVRVVRSREIGTCIVSLQCNNSVITTLVVTMHGGASFCKNNHDKSKCLVILT